MPRLAGSYKLPSTALLHRADEHSAIHEDELKNLAQVLGEKCGEFDVRGQVVQINPGPVVTTFEFKPEAGIKYAASPGCADDLCLAMRAESILIERMAGKSTVGIQVPNHDREKIWLREVVESQEYLGSKSKLTLALGKDINGRIVPPISTDAAPADRGINRLGQERRHQRRIMSMLYSATPERSPDDPGRSQAPGAGQLRRHSASATRRSSSSPSWRRTRCAMRCARWSAA